jgi:hypothetical protein
MDIQEGKLHWNLAMRVALGKIGTLSQLNKYKTSWEHLATVQGPLCLFLTDPILESQLNEPLGPVVSL